MVTAITNEQAAFRVPLHGSSVYDDASGHANLASLCQVSFVACLLSVDEHLFPGDADQTLGKCSSALGPSFVEAQTSAPVSCETPSSRRFVAGASIQHEGTGGPVLRDKGRVGSGPHHRRLPRISTPDRPCG